MGLDEMTAVAELIDRAIRAESEDALAAVRRDVRELAAAFPLYPTTAGAGELLTA
jgi:glycine/serine hydroxymethyltransferase